MRKCLFWPRLLVFDFDGVFTDNKVYVDENGKEFVCCNRSDGLGISKLHRANLEMFILSTEVNPIVMYRAKKLKLQVKNGIEDKGQFLKDLSLEKNISMEEVIYVGNDENDIEAMKLVGFAICPSDAYPVAKKQSNLILTCSGGNGAIRELCDLLLKYKPINGQMES